MKNNTLTYVVINIIFLLLIIKFGGIAIWFVAVAGLLVLFLLTISSIIMYAYAPSFYINIFSPFYKKLTGSCPPVPKEQFPRLSKTEWRWMLYVTVGIISLILLIYTVCKEVFKLISTI